MTLTVYWKRKMPQKRLKRSAVSRERLTAVALVIFTTTGMKLYSPNIHTTKTANSMAAEHNRVDFSERRWSDIPIKDASKATTSKSLYTQIL